LQKSKLEGWQVININPDYVEPMFYNDITKYSAYSPPPNFTAEEIMQMEGAKEILETVEAAQKIVDRMKLVGSLDLTGDDRWKVVDQRGE
jgi:hypothetical protein